MFNRERVWSRAVGGEDVLKLVKLALVFVGSGLSESVYLRPPVSWQNQDEPLLTSWVVTQPSSELPRGSMLSTDGCVSRQSPEPSASVFNPDRS